MLTPPLESASTFAFFSPASKVPPLMISALWMVYPVALSRRPVLHLLSWMMTKGVASVLDRGKAYGCGLATEGLICLHPV